MRTLCLSLLATAIFSSIACSPARVPKTATTEKSQPSSASPDTRDSSGADLQTLQGTWQVVSSIWNGTPEPTASRSVTFRIQGDKVTVLDRDGNRFQEETIKLLPEQNPKAIDCFRIDGNLTSLGIYSLEGETLQWCLVKRTNKVRPTSFVSDLDS